MQHYFTEGNLELKLPTTWTDEKQRWEGRREKKRREEKRREEKKKETNLPNAFPYSFLQHRETTHTNKQNKYNAPQYMSQ